MASHIGAKAVIPNPALKPLTVLVGEWETTGSHPYIPDTTLHGRTSFEWLEHGAFLMMRSEVNHPEIPDGIAIFGSDDEAKTMYILYFDERGISRKYDVTSIGSKIIWVRNQANFSQRMELTIEENGKKMIAEGKMSKDGEAWEDDIQLTYIRII